MQTQKSKQIINRNFDDLAPFFAKKLRTALAECHAAGYQVELFEGYRSSERQEYLYQLGRSLPGKIVTWARPGESFHNMSVACDLVFKINGKWIWEGQYDKVERIMIAHGFSSLKVERCHFQITGGLSAKRAWEIVQNQGMLALWSIVESSLQSKV